ncbi:MAG: hypothetical protein ACXVEE_15820 [Polyangiales bacterium]
MRAPLSLAELLAAADSGHVTFDHTLAAWIVREAAERVCQQGTVRLEAHHVGVSPDGISLLGAPIACDDQDACRALRDLLDALLRRATSSTAALRLCACRLDRTGVDMLIREIAFGSGPIDETQIAQTIAKVTDTLRAPETPAPAAAPVAAQSPSHEAELARLRAERDATTSALDAMRSARDKDARFIASLVAERESVRLDGELRLAEATRGLAANDARLAELERRLAESERSVGAKLEAAALEANVRARATIDAQQARVSELETRLAEALQRRDSAKLDGELRLAEASRGLAANDARVADLERRLAESARSVSAKSEAIEAHRARVSELEGQLQKALRHRDAPADAEDPRLALENERLVSELAAARREAEEDRQRRVETERARSEEKTAASRSIASLEEELRAARRKADAAEERHAASEKLRVAAEQQRLAAEERAVSLEERSATAEERFTASEQRRLAAEERSASLEQRRTALEERCRSLENQRAETEARLAEAERAASEREAGHRDELLQLRAEAHGERAELVASHAHALAAERRRHATIFGEEQAKQRAQLDALEAKLREAMVAASRIEGPAKPTMDLEAEVERRLADAAVSHQLALGVLRREQEDALAAAEDASVRTTTALKRAHAQALAEQESRHRAQIEKLETRVRAAEESALRAATEAKREGMKEAVSARTEALRERDAARLEFEQRHTRELQAAIARVQRRAEEEAARARDDLRCAHDSELASIRAESEATRARLTARIDELEADVFRALADRDAERTRRLDLEEATAKRIYEMRGSPKAAKPAEIPEPEEVVRQPEPRKKKPPFVALTGAALIAVLAGVGLARRGTIAPIASAAPMPVAAPSPPKECEARLSFSNLRPGTEVLRRLGATPFDVSLPARQQHELVFTHDSSEPRRTVVEASAAWSDDAVPSLTIDAKLAHRSQVDPFSGVPRRAAGPLRAPLSSPPPGVVHFHSQPAGAEVWLEVDPLETTLPCGAGVDLLLVAPLGSVDRAHVDWSEFTGTPPRAIHRVKL